MDLLTIKENTRMLAAAIDSSNEFEEKIPPFLTNKASEIYNNDLHGLHDFFEPTRAVTFSQQVACIVKQSWQLPDSKISEIVRIVRQELFRTTRSEREQVTNRLKTIFLRSHGNPFEITTRLLAVEPVSESEVLLINDERFDFDMRSRIAKRLYSARNEMTDLYAIEYLKFIGNLNDSYRKNERDEILDLAKKTSSLPYNGMLSLIFALLNDGNSLHPQGRGALNLALVSFNDKTIEAIISGKVWETNLLLCKNLIDALRYYKADTIHKLIELYQSNVPNDLKICILERLKYFFRMPSRKSSDDIIQEFIITLKEDEYDPKCVRILDLFFEDVDPNKLITDYLQDHENYHLLKQLRHNAYHVVRPLLEIIKDQSRSRQDRGAALDALSKINLPRLNQLITIEMLLLLKETSYSFDATSYKMFDCIKTDVPELKDFLKKLEISHTSNPTLKRKVISVWNRVYPDSPRPRELR